MHDRILSCKSLPHGDKQINRNGLIKMEELVNKELELISQAVF